MRMILRRKTVGLLALTALTGLTSAGCRREPLPSKEKEIQLGNQFAAEYEKKPDGPFVTRGAQYDRLMRVANRILPLARADWDVPYKVQLVDSKEVNAFAVPGGPIYFYTGLMEIAKSDDEIASVMGHELTHVTKRHSVKQMQKSDKINMGLVAIDVLVRGANTAKSAVGLFANLKMAAFSRSDEAQADEFGFKYLVQAGYNPDGMATMFSHMQEKTGKGGIEFLQSHPLTEKRIAEAQKRAKAVKDGTYKAP